MNRRDELTLLASAIAIAILFAGAVIGAAAVGVHHTDGPPIGAAAMIDAGAIDYAEDRPVAP